MRTLHDRADGHAERLAAVLALVDAGTRALAGELRDPIAHDAAARANRTLRPQQTFKMRASCIVVVENRISNAELGHGRAPSVPKI